jgi:hypothetical protein
MKEHYWISSGDSKIAAGFKYNLLVEPNNDVKGLAYVASCWDPKAVAEAGDEALPEHDREFRSLAAAEYWCEAQDHMEAATESFFLSEKSEDDEYTKQALAN